jgi:hypothetical protein
MSFSSFKNMEAFLKEPHLYEMAKLPDKLPIEY